MAHIIPKLNLNKQPWQVADYSLIDANNMIVDIDTFSCLRTEPNFIESKLTTELNELVAEDYTIKYMIECSKELVVFVLKGSDTDNLYIYRYNETETVDGLHVRYVTKTDYHGGKLIGKFLLNLENLIIIFSEYSETDNINVPLKTINLGTFQNGVDNVDISQLDSSFHPNAPEVRIPKCDINSVNGNAYKGWYYVFVRYKISNNTYTQWFNTNQSILIDSYKEESWFKYYLPTDVEDISEKTHGNPKELTYATSVLSDSTDIANNTVHCTFENLDNRYSEYQIGFICLTKSYSKCYKSFDLKINSDSNSFLFESATTEEYGLSDMIATYINYYNVKTIDVKENKVYIANYNENNLENSIADTLSNITVTLQLDTVSDTDYIEKTTGAVYYYVYTKQVDDDYLVTSTANYDNDDDTNVKEVYYTLADAGVYVRKSTSSTNNPSEWIKYTPKGGETITLYYKNPAGTDEWYNTIIDPANVIIYPNYYGADSYYSYVELKGANNGEDIKLNGVNTVSDGTAERLYVNMTSNDDANTDGDTPLYYYFKIGEMKSLKVTTGDKYSINNLYNKCILPAQPYNLFIHFIDKYGISTNGFNLKYFDIKLYDDSDTTSITNNLLKIDTNSIGDKLIYTNHQPSEYDYGSGISAASNSNTSMYCNILYKLSCSLDKLPNNYVGYFVSFEKIQKRIKYRAICKTDISNNSGYDFDLTNLKVYSDEFNFSDSLTLDFNKVALYDTDAVAKASATAIIGGWKNVSLDKYVSAKKDTDTDISAMRCNYTISEKKLYVADSYENIGLSTYLNIECDETEVDKSGSTYKTFSSNVALVELYKDSFTDYYNNINKTLIPCSHIIYVDNNGNLPSTATDLMTHTFNITLQHAIIYNHYDSLRSYFYNSSTKVFNCTSKKGIVVEPLYNYIWYSVTDQIWETLQINNAPVVQFFPEVTETTDEYEKKFNIGYIVEAKNTIDLYQQKQCNVYENYPKSYASYEPSVKYKNKFTTTLHRSNPLQDESYEISCRQFPLDAYKNISENKGDIIKIVAIGTYLFVHTQHSLYLFSSDNGIKSNADNNLQIANVDIWDIDYKEILSSKLGSGGLQKEYNSIVGDFGYVFFDASSKIIYRYDNSQLIDMSNDVYNFINKLVGYDLYLTDDKIHKRILFNFVKDNDNIVLSYNYKTNTFISFHNYQNYIGYSTKNRTYILYNGNEVYEYNNYKDKLTTEDNTFTDTDFKSGTLSIMVHDTYELMKYMEYFTYIVKKVNYKLLDDFSPIEGEIAYYAGDTLTVYSADCSTGELNLTIDTPEHNINDVNLYYKPYWRLGNWHFNMLRNKLKNYLNEELAAEDSSRIYGNWFVIKFTFKAGKQVEMKCLEVKTSNAELI